MGKGASRMPLSVCRFIGCIIIGLSIGVMWGTNRIAAIATFAGLALVLLGSRPAD